jgi:hypothetical protein
MPSTAGNIAGIGSMTVSTWTSAPVFARSIDAAANAESAALELSVATTIERAVDFGVKTFSLSISRVINSTAVI